MTLYNCPKNACQVKTETESGDVLPSNGSSGWSHQFVLPAPGSLGNPAAKQPPTIRGVVTVHTNGTSFSLDTNLEPVWTAEFNGFKNERNLRTDATVMSCNNTADAKCATWGEPGGGRATVTYLLGSSLGSLPGTADVTADIETILLPAWSQETVRSPTLNWCTNGVTCNYDAYIRVGTSTELGQAFAKTVYVNVSAGTPATFVYLEIRIKDTPYDHPCGAVDDGCTSAGGDDRVILGHELGHSLGLAHCDLNYGVMCHITATPNNELAEGTLYWTPQVREVLNLQAIYP
jgi:hypothetical protein